MRRKLIDAEAVDVPWACTAHGFHHNSQQLKLLPDCGGREKKQLTRFSRRDDFGSIEDDAMHLVPTPAALSLT